MVFTFIKDDPFPVLLVSTLRHIHLALFSQSDDVKWTEGSVPFPLGAGGANLYTIFGKCLTVWPTIKKSIIN